ncbi:MAG: beta-mannosidase [Bacteroidaceae bacterium]|nr:beta-mannosidase [Bacteroidaceae bacterium]
MRIRTFLLLMTLVASYAVQAAPKTPAQQLLERMRKLQKKGYMYGHQDDPFYGLTWEWEKGRSDTKELVGDYPAVMGFDLGGIEMGDSKNLDSVPFQRIREEIVAHHERGGIVTISWHPRNPLLGSTAWIAKDTVAFNEAAEALGKVGMGGLMEKVPNPKKTVASVLPGGSRHEAYMNWLKRVGDFLLTLKDGRGEPVPVIFRPYHENNGSWFWWGQDLCSDDEFHLLWVITQDYLNGVLPTSLVWSYSPNLQGNWTEEAWMRRYPGDDRVDLIGEDAYQWGTEADFVTALTADLTLITAIAKKHGKLIALTECGYQNSPDATWWQRVFKPIVEQFPVCYFLPWRNYKKDHFGASPAATTADDFKAWAAQKRFLFNKDIQKIK